MASLGCETVFFAVVLSIKEKDLVNKSCPCTY